MYFVLIAEQKHPSIIKIYQIVSSDEQISIVMENAKLKGLFGHCFWQSFNKKNKLDSENRIVGVGKGYKMFKQLLQGVEYCKKCIQIWLKITFLVHSEKIGHRDLKPQNVLVTSDFDLKICDFGISKDYSEQENDIETEVIGTIAFHPPEIYKGNSQIIFGQKLTF